MKQNLFYVFFINLVFQTSFSQTVTLDATFGTNGKVLHHFAQNSDALNAIAVQQDGKVLISTLNEFSLSGNVMVSRFNVDGTLDSNFGVNGTVETQLVSETGGYNLMKLQNDGKILITGSKLNGPTSDFFDFATMRYNSDGSIDADFGTNGIVITDINGKGDISNVIDLQSDNKIIVGGYTYSNTNQNACVSLVRYLNDGTIDTTFGTNGKLLLPLLASTLNSYDYTNCIKVTSNGNILIGANTTAGETVEDYTNTGIFKINSDGVLDTSFNTTGYKLASFGANDVVSAINEYNGKVIISGYSSFPGGSKIFTSRFLADGTPDDTFGVNGVVIGNRTVSNLYDAVTGMKVLSNGKLLCTGFTLNETNADFLLIQFNTDGTIDTGFNNVGYFMTDFNNNTNDVSGAIDIGADGKIVCAGLTDLNAIRVTSLARYSLNELSNASFAANSFLVYPNPFSESILIESKKINLVYATVQLYDMNGRKLSEYKSDGLTDFTIPMDKNLPKGNYFLTITKQEKIATIKLIKQ